MEKQKIESKYMMATTAIHKLGDISSDGPDICRVSEEDEGNYYGSWVTGFGFFGVRFPKETTRDLTSDEIERYKKLSFRINSQPPFKLKL